MGFDIKKKIEGCDQDNNLYAIKKNGKICEKCDNMTGMQFWKQFLKFQHITKSFKKYFLLHYSSC